MSESTAFSTVRRGVCQRWTRTLIPTTREAPSDAELPSHIFLFLAHYAREVGARHILRGIRDEEDYRYERGMRYINSDLNAEATTVFLMPPRSLGQVSSSFVKGMIGPEGWEPIVRGYVPGCVFEDLVAWDAERGARSRD
jgi:pantetheine-phosphate adenylyltransferase